MSKIRLLVFVLAAQVLVLFGAGTGEVIGSGIEFHNLSLPYATEESRSARDLEYSALQITNHTASQIRPAMAVSQDGICSLVWQDNRDGNYEIYFCRISQSLELVVPPTRITNTSANSNIPKVDTDSSGNSYIVWTENTPGINARVYYAKVGSMGSILVAPTLLFSGGAWDPVISTNADGVSGIAYQGQSGVYHLTYFETRNASGAVLSARQYLRRDTVTTTRYCSIDDAPDGNFWVYRREYDYLNGAKYWISRVSPAGTIMTNQVLLSDNGLETCIAMVGNTSGYLEYVDRYSTGTTNYYSIRSGFDGDLDYSLGGDSRWPQICENPVNTNSSIIWEVNRSNSGDYDLYGAIELPDGTYYVGYLFENSVYDARYPGVGYFPDGTTCFAWQDNRNGNEDIYFAKYGTNVLNYTISGYVRGSNNLGVSGVTVTATGLEDFVTQADGVYQFNVPEGWSGEISASLPGWLFNPPQLIVPAVTGDLLEQNFIGLLAPPIFSHPEGNYPEPITVQLSTEAAGAVIRYIIGDGTPYSIYGHNYYLSMSGIPINQNTEITAVAYIPAQGAEPSVSSDLVTQSYEINGGLPLLNIHLNYQNHTGPTGSKIRLVFKNENEDDEDNVEAVITGNNISQLDKTQIQSKIAANNPTTRLEIRDGENLLGHVDFKYELDDLVNNKTLDLLLTVAGPPDTNGYPSWNYYQAGEEMVYMLVPPSGSLPETASNRLPVLLVHGLNGSYPYWNADFVSGIESEYDTWQIYFPYDQQVEKNAQLLDSAIAQVLSTDYYPSGTKVSLVTHSMGGVVSRYYIQNTQEYNDDIRKILMVAPPNHGSFIEYKICNGEIIPVIGSIFKGNDLFAPANSQLRPGSTLMNSLNASAPQNLYDGATLNRTYLVIAGTKNDLLSRIHHELIQMDDMVVAVPSASLLDDGIPLATIHMDHTQLKGGLSHHIVLNFLDDDYDPANTSSLNYSNIFNHAEVNGFWYDMEHERKHDPNLPSNLLGTLQLRCANSMDIRQFNVIRLGAKMHIIRDTCPIPLALGVLNPIGPELDDLIDDLEFIQYDGQKSSYLYINDMALLNNPSFNGLISLSMRDMGFPGPSQDYGIKFHNMFGVQVTPSVLSSSEITRFKSNTVDISFSQDQLGVLNATNLISSFDLIKERDDYGRTLNLAYYLVDDQSETAIFYLRGNDDDTGFAGHGLVMSTPSGTIIDSLYAATHPEWIYVSNTEDNYAYYYTQNPQAGTWTMQYSDQLQDPVPYCFVDGSYILSLNLSDSVAEIGQTVSTAITIPGSVQPANCTLSALLSRTSSSGSEYDLGPLTLAYDAANLVYNGSFVTQYPGVYKLAVQGQFVEDGGTATRYIEGFVQVDSLGLATLLQPQQDSVIEAGSVSFTWSPATNATGYTLQVFGLESNTLLHEVTLTDTMSILSLPSDTSCGWRIIAHANDQTTFSPTGFFRTSLAQAICVTPANYTVNLAQVVDLAWEPVEGAESYGIQVGYDSLFANPVMDMVNLGQTTLTLEGLSNQGIYFWRVRGVRDDLAGPWSDSFAFTIRSYTIDFPVEVIIPEDEWLSLYLPRYIDNFDPTEFQITLLPMVQVSTELGIDSVQITPAANWHGQENLIIVLDSTNRLFNLKNNQFSTPTGNRYTLTDTIRVVVPSINDLPVLDFQGELAFWDTESKVVDLAPYICDPDNPLDEVRLTALGSSHISISVTGLEITFLPQAGWFGEELIELSLDNIESYDRATRTSSRSESMNDRNVSVYSITVAIIDPTPLVTDIQIIGNGVSLVWDPVQGADAYAVLHSASPGEAYTDVTSTGTMTLQEGHLLWQQNSTVGASGFFKVIASKGEISGRGSKEESWQ